MKESKLHITSLQNLLDHDAQKFIIAEIKLKNILPEWINQIDSIQLRTILLNYVKFIQVHVQKMEHFFEEENINSLSLHNRIMEAFIEETSDKLSNCEDPAIKNACLLASIQDINHFKISSYGTAAAFSNALGLKKFATIFHEAEENEKEIDSKLSVLANKEVNNMAKAPIALTS